ncbi:kelch domain-containing protein 1 [Cynoglossus semilaevis]|uniref:Kelch domain-containing protein 1 n=1 Tax=Cynoglossus semilaevis TaxID=244447 RepID=A0A3P8UW02_CYNSE|nr:kelch domain-containing protein 1 [Cynoglossus semilaevis]
MDTGAESQCSELVARERSGHTAVVTDDNLLYVWGGYVSVAESEVFLSNTQIWVYDIQQGVWEVFYMTGEVPPPMSGICGCFLDGQLYMFGGCDMNGQTNQMYCVNLTDGNYTWRKVRAKRGSVPSPRDKVSCWTYEGRIIYFGGYGHKALSDIDNSNRNFIVDEAAWVEDVFWGWNNEVHIFDPAQTSWTRPHTCGNTPAPRAAHASATSGCKGYIFGGRVMETRKNDIHCMDLNTMTWSEIIPVTPSPVGRSWHTLTAVSENTLFLFGGLSSNCTPMSDGWLFDLQTKKWTEIQHPHGNKPRLWHTACLGRDSDVIVFGGSCDYILLVDTGHCNDALVFQMQPYPLYRICEDFIAKNVRNNELLRNQLHFLPPKLLSAVQRRMNFYRPSKKKSAQ